MAEIAALDVAGAAQSLWHYELNARQDNKRLDLTKPNRTPSGRPIDRLRSSAAKRCLGPVHSELVALDAPPAS